MRLVRPAACRRARSSRSCNSLSSKSSRSSVAACSMILRLVSLLNCSDRSESSERDEAAEHVGGDRKSELHAPAARRGGRARRLQSIAQRWVGSRMRRKQHDLVDDELADVQRCDGQQRAYDPQQRLTDRQRGAGSPDELQERRKVAQCAEALAEAPALKRRRQLAGKSRRRTAPIAYFFGMPHCAGIRGEAVNPLAAATAGMERQLLRCGGDSGGSGGMSGPQKKGGIRTVE